MGKIIIKISHIIISCIVCTYVILWIAYIIYRYPYNHSAVRIIDHIYFLMFFFLLDCVISRRICRQQFIIIITFIGIMAICNLFNINVVHSTWCHRGMPEWGTFNIINFK